MRSMISITLLLLAPASTSLATSTAQTPIALGKDSFAAVRKALEAAKIISEVLDDFQPRCFLAPFYGKKSNRAVTLGNSLKQSVTEDRPTIKIYCPGLDSTAGLVVALTDPDAKSRDDPKWSEMCHWIAIVPTSNQKDFVLDVSNGSNALDIVEYKSPAPPAKTGYHRYVFVLLQGATSNLTAPSERQHCGTGKVRHGVRDWAQREGLEVVGANFFMERNGEL
ncbi:uncharacterized protein L3040_006605 [Drepanopeziza brunnea f. sp. 'multigermtubi']|nr:hypothetical protein L3040_006605 [Drepanopeziza brunnea f. sp. 'multigermtubi']